MAFEYRYRFSVDEEIIRRYDCNDSRWHSVKYMLEVRTNFIVKGRCGGGGGDERIIDHERYAVDAVKGEYEDYLQFYIGMRLRDYWMPDHEIRRLINQFVLFAKQIAAGGRRGKIPAAVDLDVCTAQREGEEIAAAADRAMRPEFLPPLHLYPVRKEYEGFGGGGFTMADLVGKLAAVRVEDVAEASAVMVECGVCGRKPVVGTQISTLRCGHAIHYHCFAAWLSEMSNSCPICNHRPGFDESSSGALDDIGPSFLSHCVRFLGFVSDSDESESESESISDVVHPVSHSHSHSHSVADWDSDLNDF